MNRGIRFATIATIIVLAGMAVFLIGSTGQPVRGEQDPAERRLLVNGTGEVEATPDSAEVTVGVESEADTATLAQQQNAKIMAAAVDAVKKAGVASEDIQASGYNLFPVRPYGKASGREKLAGFRASNQLHVTVRNLENIGKLIDEAVRAGATPVEQGKIMVRARVEMAFEI